ncbi:hypothetical protein BSU04_25160 [Caballeronia sordidicola]|uniref:Uncharacterized protein n=1 Tax=Caballeronia sordidicola TaxID=196367 RepID=A0A226WX89_CABSO|nr:hypothetical protein BSU04_25160 [Caballeronia sordidicola]
MLRSPTETTADVVDHDGEWKTPLGFSSEVEELKLITHEGAPARNAASSSWVRT